MRSDPWRSDPLRSGLRTGGGSRPDWWGMLGRESGAGVRGLVMGAALALRTAVLSICTHQQYAQLGLPARPASPPCAWGASRPPRAKRGLSVVSRRAARRHADEAPALAAYRGARRRLGLSVGLPWCCKAEGLAEGRLLLAVSGRKPYRARIRLTGQRLVWGPEGVCLGG